jgi:hypothetical protein
LVNVDFPEPDGPMIPMISPGRTTRDTFRKIGCVPGR